MNTEELQDLIDYLCVEYGYGHKIECRIRDTQGSYAQIRRNKKTGKLQHTLQVAAYAVGKSAKYSKLNRYGVAEYSVAVAIHEFCHFLSGLSNDHNSKFRRNELDILDSFGLIATGYKKAYWTVLQSKTSGKVFFKQS